MPYCTQDDLLTEIPVADLAQLTNAEANAAEPDAAAVAEAIAKADSEINSYLLVRYTLPLAEPIPDQVKSLSVDLAIYKLYMRRSLLNEARRQAYEDAVSFLKLVAKGQAVIEGASGVEPAGAVEDVTEVSSQPRVFDRDSLRGY